jgi:uncharacterized membrane protein
MYETESNPVQPSSLGRGVAMAGYWSMGATWLLALLVMLLLFGAFWWMGRYNARSLEQAEAQRAAAATEEALAVPSFE